MASPWHIPYVLRISVTGGALKTKEAICAGMSTTI